MEADLQSIYGIDYRDRWRTRDGRPVLTLRRLAVLLMRGLPEGSSLLSEHVGQRPWSRLEGLVDDVRMRLEAQLGVRRPEPHPGRVAQASHAGATERRAAEFARRRADRDRRLRRGSE